VFAQNHAIRANTQVRPYVKIKKKMKNNIDKIFNESLKNYERQPRTEAWEKLKARLEKKDNKIVPLWWKYASAASIVLLLGVGGYWFVSNSSNESPSVATNIEVKTPLSVNPKSEILNEKKSKENGIAKTIDLKQKNINSSPVAGVHTSPHVSKQTQKLEDISPVVDVQSKAENQNNSIIALETIKPKTSTEDNTIVLVLENTKPKKEEETIVLNFVDTKVETVAQNIEPEKKQSRVGKIWEQLKRAKNGEDVNWGRLGVKPQKVLARADAKIENALSKGEEENNR
jgi:hypothetical protein